MARPRRHDGDPSGGDRPRRRPRATTTKTDLSIFLRYPLASMPDAEFRDLCERIRGVLRPRNDLERRGIEMILWAFVRVRRASQAVAHDVPGAGRYLETMLESFRSRQKTFDLLRKIVDSDPDCPIPIPDLTPPPDPIPEPPPAPTSPPAPEPEPADRPDPDDEVDAIEAAARDWRTRIAMVPSVDPRWPVLDQFDLRVDDLLTLRDQGVPEDELLDRYPGLTYTDLAACYACEADGYRGPLEPPYPEDITLVEPDPESD